MKEKTYVELTKHVTGRKRHIVQVCRIPSRHDDTSIFWIVFNFVNAFCQLVHTLPRVVGMHIHVVRPKVTPLKAIDWTEVAHLTMLQAAGVQELARAVAVPNVNVFGRQLIGIGAPLTNQFKNCEKRNVKPPISV